MLSQVYTYPPNTHTDFDEVKTPAEAILSTKFFVVVVFNIRLLHKIILAILPSMEV